MVTAPRLHAQRPTPDLNRVPAWLGYTRVLDRAAVRICVHGCAGVEEARAEAARGKLLVVPTVCKVRYAERTERMVGR